MKFIRPATWDEALAVKGEHPEADPLMGGTDVLVEMNFGRHRPELVLDLADLSEVSSWEVDGDWIRVGAGLSYARIVSELHEDLPGLAMAARTVGSPQIRNRGTVAGNLGTASPAGDALPPLLASAAEVEAASTTRTRRISVREFFLPGGRHVLEPDELIAAVHVPRARGGQQFAKIGPRNAMVIAACSFSLAIDATESRIGTGVGSAGPTPLCAPEAERFLEGILNEGDRWERPWTVDASAYQRFGALVAQAAQPIDDVRATAAYRRHALAVLARRTLRWTSERNGHHGVRR